VALIIVAKSSFSNKAWPNRNQALPNRDRAGGQAVDHKPGQKLLL
jgi:hypothetical protein